MTDVSGPVARGTAKPLIAAAQYLRMSSDQQVFSLESQAGVIAAFAEKQGYEIVETYSDAGRSGVTAAGRGGLLRLLRDVAALPRHPGPRCQPVGALPGSGRGGPLRIHLP